ncbi:MAG: GNAT family N-acetyltransferase [bacterium]
MNALVLSSEELSDHRLTKLAAPYLFSSPGFSRLWQHTGGRPAWLGVEDEGRLIAFVPGVEFGLRGLRRWQSMPDGCYGRLFVDTEDTAARRFVAATVMASLAKSRFAKVHLTDYDHSFHPSDDWEELTLSTTLVDIGPPDWMPDDKKMRQQIRAAERRDYRVIPFAPRLHMPAFWSLVEKSSRRQGRSPRYPRSFYEALSQLAAEDDRLRWLWMEVDGQAVASSIFVVEGDQVVHWHIFYDESLSEYQPSKYLPYVAARAFAQSGGRLLNLGATPPNLPGVEEYKRKWGGELYHYRCLIRRRGIGRLL